MIEALFYFGLGLCLMWFATGFVVTGVERFAKNLSISTFITSFLLLGLLTSLTEISVGLNAYFDHAPEVFVGNLIGGSFVILLFIIPLLAIANKSIRLEGALTLQELMMFLLLIASPAFVILDGEVGTYDAILLILFYGLFIYQYQRTERIIEHVRSSGTTLKAAIPDLVKVVFGAAIIYFAAKMLVDAIIVIAESVKISSLLLSLLFLSIGTNLPELVVAMRAIRNRQTEIAFGDYVGSAAFNPFLFGMFSLINGPFSLQVSGFELILLIMIIGYVMFFLFARSKSTLSPVEGFLLMIVFLFFILLQVNEIIVFSPIL